MLSLNTYIRYAKNVLKIFCFCRQQIIGDASIIILLITVHELRRQIDLLLKGSLVIRLNFPSAEEAATLKTHQIRVIEFNKRNAHMISDSLKFRIK